MKCNYTKQIREGTRIKQGLLVKKKKRIKQGLTGVNCSTDVAFPLTLKPSMIAASMLPLYTLYYTLCFIVNVLSPPCAQA